MQLIFAVRKKETNPTTTVSMRIASCIWLNTLTPEAWKPYLKQTPLVVNST